MADETPLAPETPILEGPKPAEKAPPGDPIDPKEAEARLDAAKAAMRKQREDACAREVEAVLARFGCFVRPKFSSRILPMGSPGEAVFGACIEFHGFDFVAR